MTAGRDISDARQRAAERRIVELEARVALLEAERDHLAAELVVARGPVLGLARHILNRLRRAWTASPPRS